MVKAERNINTSPTCMTDANNEPVVKPVYKRATGLWGTRFWTGVMGRAPKAGPSWIHGGSFSKPYFTASIVGYVLGMMTTVGVMHVFSHAQPALLYLVPSVLCSLWSTALVKGELDWMWNWSEAELEDGKETMSEKVTLDVEENNSTVSVELNLDPANFKHDLEDIYQVRLFSSFETNTC